MAWRREAESSVGEFPRWMLRPLVADWLTPDEIVVAGEFDAGGDALGLLMAGIRAWAVQQGVDCDALVDALEEANPFALIFPTFPAAAARLGISSGDGPPADIVAEVREERFGPR